MHRSVYAVLIFFLSLCVIIFTHHYSHKYTVSCFDATEKVLEPLPTLKKDIPSIIDPEPIYTNKKICYTTLKKEMTDSALIIEGNIPSWLSGTFYYNGPAQFELPKHSFKHNFDGLAMIHRFNINGKTISYTNKFVESVIKKEAYATGKLPIGFVESGNPSWFNKLSALLAQPKKFDNTNMHVWNIGNKLLAVTETPHHIQIHPETLKTLQPYQFPCQNNSHTCCIHPWHDVFTQKWYNVYTRYGHMSEYQICSINPQSLERTVISKIPVDYPGYIHSFGLTKDYIILVEQPFMVNPYDLLGSSKTFVDHFVWKPQTPNRFFIIQKNVGKVVHSITMPYSSFFFFHIINAFQEKDLINCDIITYPDTNIVQSSSLLTKLIDYKKTKDKGIIERFSINLKDNSISRKLLSKEHIEFPIFNRRYAQQNYQFLYGVDYTDTAIKKIDLKTGVVKKWQKTNCYVMEPQFIASPNSATEDAGVLIFLATDIAHQKSGLIILDAHTFKLHACAWLTHYIPHGFHGTFLENN